MHGFMHSYARFSYNQSAHWPLIMLFDTIKLSKQYFITAARYSNFHSILAIYLCNSWYARGTCVYNYHCVEWPYKLFDCFCTCFRLFIITLCKPLKLSICFFIFYTFVYCYIICLFWKYPRRLYNFWHYFRAFAQLN